MSKRRYNRPRDRSIRLFPDDLPRPIAFDDEGNEIGPVMGFFDINGVEAALFGRYPKRNYRIRRMVKLLREHVRATGAHPNDVRITHEADCALYDGRRCDCDLIVSSAA